MKEKLSFILILTMLVSVLAGCSGTPVIYYSNCTCPDGSHDPTNDETDFVPTEGALKTGLAIVTNISGSENAKQADYDVTLVAVIVDDSGIIQDCIIDSIGTKVTFDAAGMITSDLTADILSKTELGDAYGLKQYAGSKYEWYEQAASFAKYVTGKTAAEVAGIAISEGKPSDTDLASSVTISIGGFQALIAKVMK